MTTDVWVALLFFGLLWGGILGLVFWQRRQRQRQQETLRSAAAAQGWTFEAQRQGHIDLMRWRGSTDGTAWTLEYRHSRRTRRSQNSHVHRTVWWADTFRGPSSPVVFMAVSPGSENPTIKLAHSDGFLASLAQKAAGFALDKAVDVHFGDEAGTAVDGRQLQAVPDAAVPGFLVMAVDPQQARWLLADGWSRQLGALERESGASTREAPSVLVLPRRVFLARQKPLRAVADVQAMVREGLSLVKPLA